jgi:hypothetical protein
MQAESNGCRLGRTAEIAAAVARKNTQPKTLERAVWTQDRGAGNRALAEGRWRAPITWRMAR